jgi:hypothetical protein
MGPCHICGVVWREASRKCICKRVRSATMIGTYTYAEDGPLS